MKIMTEMLVNEINICYENEKYEEGSKLINAGLHILICQEGQGLCPEAKLTYNKIVEVKK